MLMPWVAGRSNPYGSRLPDVEGEEFLGHAFLFCESVKERLTLAWKSHSPALQLPRDKGQ